MKIALDHTGLIFDVASLTTGNCFRMLRVTPPADEMQGTEMRDSSLQ
jgi:hypothetical protein